MNFSIEQTISRPSGVESDWFGPWRRWAAESREKYDRLIAEFLAAGRNVNLMSSVTRQDRFCLIDLIAAFKDHAEPDYIKDDEPTKTIANPVSPAGASASSTGRFLSKNSGRDA